MSECTRFQHLLDAYVDGELAPWQRHKVSRHLERCQECNQHVLRSRSLRQAIHEFAMQAASDVDWTAFWPELREAIATEPAPTTSWADKVKGFWQEVSRPAWVTAAAAAAFLLIFIYPHLSYRAPSNEILLEPIASKNITYVVTHYEGTNTSIIWIIEKKG